MLNTVAAVAVILLFIGIVATTLYLSNKRSHAITRRTFEQTVFCKNNLGTIFPPMVPEDHCLKYFTKE
jgi:hypothetical protein